MSADDDGAARRFVVLVGREKLVPVLGSDGAALPRHGTHRLGGE